MRNSTKPHPVFERKHFLLVVFGWDISFVVVLLPRTISEEEEAARKTRTVGAMRVAIGFHGPKKHFGGIFQRSVLPKQMSFECFSRPNSSSVQSIRVVFPCVSQTPNLANILRGIFPQKEALLTHRSILALCRNALEIWIACFDPHLPTRPTQP